jgi:hypothetical protein
VLASQAILGRFRQDPVGFVNRLLTVDETWIRIHDTGTKEQPKEWRLFKLKTITANLDKLKQQLVSKRRRKLSEGNLFLQDNSAPQKTAITHQKLADFYFEVL